MSSLRRGVCFLASLTVLCLAYSVSAACPFCMEEKGPTLSGDYAEAAMVLFGTFKEGRQGIGVDEGSTDFEIETVVKSHDLVKNKKVITLPRYLPPTKSKFLVFIGVFKGALDPFRGVESSNGAELIKYLTGATALKEKSSAERLRYAFDYLNSSEFEVSMDAYREFARAPYADYKDIAKKLPPDVIAGWLRDPKTPPYRYGLYASLLGHCGKAEHAKILRDMLDDAEKRRGSGLDGLLAGQIMIQPKEGFTYLTRLLQDSQQEFLVRYACLRTLRFLWDQRPDLIPREKLVSGVALLLNQPDMADFGIEDLRKWKRWEMTGDVLGLFEKESHDARLVKRAILRFALQSPEKKAAEFVQAQRRKDADWVRETEELLQVDVQSAVPAAKEGSTKK